MKITIDDELCIKHDLPLEKLLLILLIKSTDSIPELIVEMLNDQMIIKNDLDKGSYLITQRWNEVAETIILDSDKNSKPIDELESLILKLQEIFPTGKKDGTNQYWRGNKRELLLRLKKFFKLYGEDYDHETIINAAKAYVTSFNGNYSHMRILKYFIWKDEKKRSEDGTGMIVETSDLANYIENSNNSEQSSSNDWTTTLN